MIWVSPVNGAIPPADRGDCDGDVRWELGPANPGEYGGVVVEVVVLQALLPLATDGP